MTRAFVLTNHKGGVGKSTSATDIDFGLVGLLRDFIPSYTGDGMIPCIIVPVRAASPFRQAKENTSRAGLNAIAMSRQVALLRLHVHEIPIPDGRSGQS